MPKPARPRRQEAARPGGRPRRPRQGHARWSCSTSSTASTPPAATSTPATRRCATRASRASRASSSGASAPSSTVVPDPAARGHRLDPPPRSRPRRVPRGRSTPSTRTRGRGSAGSWISRPRPRRRPRRQAPAERPSRRGPPPSRQRRGGASLGGRGAPDVAAPARGRSGRVVRLRARARRSWSAPWRRAAGRPRPAAALLALLVDTLGRRRRGARARRASLSRAALARPEVRGLLGARGGARGEIRRRRSAWLRGASDAKAAEALAVLGGARALGRGRRAGGGLLAEIRKRDPAHPAIVGLAGEIARLRAAERGPVEAELAALVAAGREGEAEKKAAEVLARWPDSEAARRVLKAGGGAAEAGAGGRRAPGARGGGGARGGEREAARVEEVRTRLGASRARGRGCSRWLELGAAQRRRVEAPGAAELLRWLELTPARAAPAARGWRRCSRSRARGGGCAGDPEGAIEALAPHEEALERVPEARRVAQEAQAELGRGVSPGARGDRRRRAARSARGDAAGGARAAPGALAARDLGDGPERAEAEALRAEAARVVAAERRVGEVGRLRQAGQLFEARALAEALAAEAEGDEQRRWEEERRAIQEEIQRAFCVEIDTERPAGRRGRGPRGLDAPRWSRRLAHRGTGARWCSRGARHAGSGIRARRRRPPRRSARRSCSAPPSRWGTCTSSSSGSIAWLTGQDGALLAFDVERLEVELFRSARELLPAGLRTGQAAVAADERARLPRFYWSLPADAEGYARRRRAGHRPRAAPGGARAPRGRPRRDPARRGARRASPARAPTESRSTRTAALRRPEGASACRASPIMCAAVHPSGEGLVLVGTVGSDDAPPHHRPRRRAGGRPVARAVGRPRDERGSPSRGSSPASRRASSRSSASARCLATRSWWSRRAGGAFEIVHRQRRARDHRVRDATPARATSSRTSTTRGSSSPSAQTCPSCPPYEPTPDPVDSTT